MTWQDHPQRASLSNELHARPYPGLSVPARVAFVALKVLENAAERDRRQDLAHLSAMLDHFALPAPEAGVNHYMGQFGSTRLKWEQHTELATYTLLSTEPGQGRFDPGLFDLFPKAWQQGEGPHRLTSVLIDVLPWEDDATVNAALRDVIDPEGVVVSNVLDDAALIAGDFRMDARGHLRFLVFVRPGTGPQRVGRIVQRLCEIETYKTLSMLGFARARDLSLPLIELDRRLTSVIGAINRHEAADQTLASLLEISAEIEQTAALSSFRFSATGAYEAIVHQRIGFLREQRWQGRQTFSEFLMRRYDPAMRTVKSTMQKLDAMSARAARAADLLRTQVDVERSANSEKLLESMDKRADAQLNLQKTVEGLSVVAISYYAVSLAGYALAPMGKAAGISKPAIYAAITLPIIAVVAWVVRRIRARH